MPDWQLPEGVLVYAIGDIHGRMDLLTLLMDKIEADLANRGGYHCAYLVPLGDYIDRGRDSALVVDYFAQFQHRILKLVPLMGNHEILMQQFIQEPETGPMWFSVGGLAALQSYGVHAEQNASIKQLRETALDFERAIPAHHKTFLNDLQIFWQCGDYYFVHAGIRPSIPLHEQKRRDLVGIRSDFTSSDKNHGVCVVHGHTGVDAVHIAPNRIALDTGAFVTGRLSAMAFQGAEQTILCSDVSHKQETECLSKTRINING